MSVRGNKNNVLTRVDSAGGHGDRPEEGLTVAQKDALVSAGVQALADVGAIAKGLIAIAAIKQKAASDVAVIRAETEQKDAEIRGQISLHMARANDVKERGRVVVELIEAVTRQLKEIPELDNDTRREAVSALKEYVRMAVVDR